MKKRILALFLVAAMAVGIFPTALAVRDERPEIPEDLAAQNIEGDVPTDGDTQAAPVVPTVVEDVPAVLAAADAEATTYDYTGTVTASAPSYQAASGANSPAAALDNNTGTWWHTAWNGNNGGTGSLTDLINDPDNRYIQLDLTETIQLDGLRYLSRAMETNSDYGNGVVTQYRIEVSTDGTNFTSVAAGSWEPGASAWRIAVFPEAVQAQYVRLYGVRTYGNGEGFTSNPITSDVNKYMSAAELRLLTGVPDDWRPLPDTPDGNLCRPTDNATVTATVQSVESGTSFTGDKVIDGNQTTRWSTDRNAEDTSLVISLGALRTVSSVVAYWCGEEQSAVSGYTISVSNSATGPWSVVKTYSGTVVAVRGDNDEHTPIYDDFDPVAARYVKLESTGYRSDASWKSMALWEVEVYRDHQTPSLPETPAGNLCRPTDGVTVTATASTNENSNVTPDKAIDGGFTNSSASSADVERWASSTASGGQWLQIDLGASRTVSIIKLFWQHDSVTAYNVQISSDGTTWTTVYNHTSGRITELNKVINITPQACQYIKINATAYDNQGSASWGNVSIWEVEAYRDEGAIPQTPTSLLDKLQAVEGGPLEVNSDENKVVLKQAALDLVPEDFTVTFAANLEQVVGADGVIYTPVVDKEVAIDLTVTNAEGASAATPANSPIRLTIPGRHAAAENEGGNPKPAVIPEIMEWYSHGTDAGYLNQSYTLSEGSVRILYRYAFAGVAGELKADLKDLYGIDAELKRLNDTAYTTLQNIVQDGDIVLFDVNPNSSNEDTRNRVQGYDDETYGMEIYGGKVYIYATHSTGAYWGTRTLLQGLKLSGDERSFPNGTLRDYPEFKVRGFMLDVGRKPQSMDTLYNIVKNMAWYKLNDFHLHLNDDLIFMEDYCEESDRSDYQSAYEAYSAFRLESNIQEEAGAKPLTAKDYAYTKAEFKQFVQDSRALGVEIVPEIDVPAHAKALTDAFPSLRLNKSGTFSGTTRPWIDHLDLTNKMNESVAKVNEIFNEYIDEGVFDNIVHFGADEYYDTYSAYAPFAKAMVDNIQSKGRTVRMWGSLSTMGDSNHLFTKEVAQNIQMNIWSTGWANPTAMYNLGFSLINITDGPFYMVPNGGGGRGGYGDYLNLTDVYNKAPNQIGNTWFPASSSQILGESFAIWMDNIDTRASGLDEVDTFARFFDTLPVVAVRQWGVENNTPARTLTELQADAAIIGTAPQTDSYYYQADDADFFSYDFSDKTDKSGNGHDLTLTNAEINSSKSLLVLKGGVSYAETGLDRLGWGSQLSFRALKLTGGGEEEILFEADHAYGDFSIKALPVEGKENVWKLGFSRELYDYEFDVELPVGQWVKLTLTNEKQSAKLSVDGGAAVAAVGKFVSKPDSNTQFRGKTGITLSSFELPVARIGSKTNAFKGYIAAVSTGEPIDIPFMTASSPSFNNDGIPFKAIDGDPSTIYHSNWNSPKETNGEYFADLPADQRYIQLDLTTPVTLSGLKHLRRNNGGNGTITSYEIKVSTDGENYTSVKTGSGWGTANDWDVATFTPQSGVVSVRLYGTTTVGDFMSAAEIELVYEPINLAAVNATVTVGDVTWGETEATAEITVVLESGFVLTEGTDYTVSYENNTAAGTATVTVTGTGGYTGSLSATFTVPAKPIIVDLSTATVTFAQTSYPLENGKAEPDPTVKVGNTTLLRGLDYTVTYENNTAVGTATATITGTGDYSGSTTADFTITAAIVKKDLSNTAKTKVTLQQTTFPYEGTAITPEVVVTYDGETLVKGTHYTVSYARNNVVGTATVTVVGRAPYCEGSASATFTIVDPAKGNDLSDVTKTVVTLKPTQYEYTGKPIIPTFTVRYNGVRLLQDIDFTVELSRNVNGGTGVLVIHGKGDYYGSFVTTFTINGGGAGTGDNPGNTGSNTGSSGGATVVISSNAAEVEKRDDGTTVTTITDRQTGTVITEAKYADGSTVTSAITAKGEITATVTLPKNAEEATVVIPTKQEPSLGQVAVIIYPDGTEEIVKDSLATEDGMLVTLTEDAQIKVVDNTKEFVDVAENHWAKDAITYVTSREIFNGTGSGTFTPNDAMSRAMVCTVLANLEGVDTSGGQVWYEKAVDWAKDQKVSDGTNPSAIVSREQLVTMLYRYAGSPATSGSMAGFTDAGKVSSWAAIPMAWAIQKGLITGRDNGELDPAASASRAEVAVIFQRYLSMKK